MLKTGDFNPHRFKKPSLPVYMMAAAFAVGYSQACSRLELENIREIGVAGYPFYPHGTVVFPARALYALLSVITMVFIGVVAFRLTRLPCLMFLVPLLLSVSDFYLSYSWSYLNVDIIGCFFAVALVFFLIGAYDAQHSVLTAVVAGALCGLAVGSKYNYGLLLLPCLLYYLLRHRARWLTLSLLTFGVMSITFLLTTPYALLDVPSFLNGVGFELHHYAGGVSRHAANELEPGLAQAWYYIGSMSDSFGWALPLFAVVGVFYTFRLDWGRALVVLSFPVSFLMYMSSQRLHFLRNILPLHIFFAFAAAIGLLAGHRLLVWAFGKVPFPGCPRGPSDAAEHSRGQSHLWPPQAWGRCLLSRGAASTVILTVLISASLPWGRIAKAYDLAPESRNVAIAWIQNNIDDGSTLVIARELAMDVQALLKNYEVVEVAFKKQQIDPTKLKKMYRDVYILAPEFVNEQDNSLFNTTRALERFGTHKVKGGKISVSGGDPSFVITKP